MHRRMEQIRKRLRLLKKGDGGKGPVVYWMSREQRVLDNWALLAAQEEALFEKRGLCVVFCLDTDYPFLNQRNGAFLLQGVQEVQRHLAALNISFVFLQGDPTWEIPRFLEFCDGAMLICDFDPLRVKRDWKEKILSRISQPCSEVDAHNIIPVWITSEKREYGAYTIRPKIARLLTEYLTDIPKPVQHPWSVSFADAAFDMQTLLAQIGGHDIALCEGLVSGPDAAGKKVEQFIQEKLEYYAARRNNPCFDGQSGLSPYLHFGQIAPQRVALLVQASDLPGKDVFLEELIVRRELSDNFCYYCDTYDSVDCFPDWARRSLELHESDNREYIYDFEEFAQAKTHEKLWNRCQLDLVQRGKLHGYLRMYWGKKILEWSENAEMAMKIALSLNDTYSLDGRDPNGYAGVAWSLGGVHDRAWPERKIFGKIRYMNESGCRRKFDVDWYIARLPGLEGG